MKKKFTVLGMHCAGCAARLEKVMGGVAGVNRAEVNLLKNRLMLDYDAHMLTEEQICDAVAKAGYKASVLTEQTSSGTAGTEEEILYQRFWHSLLFLVPLLYFSMGEMLGLPFPALLANPPVRAWGQLFLILPLLWINRSTYQNGIKNLFHFSPNMSSLISLGSGAAVLYSLWGLAHQEFHLYFEAAGMILTFMTLGRYLETRAKGKTSHAIELLLHLTPKRALKRVAGQEKEILAEEIKVGDVLLVKAGMSVPADGVIEKGHGALDESSLTGESLPVDKTVGASVRAGTLNTAGYFEFVVTKTGADTLLAQIVRLVEDASASKAPIGRLADKVSGIFVPVVLGLSILTLLAWLLCGQPFHLALRAAVAVLVISCPCALGLATPTAIMVGVGVGARKGVLFKSAAVLENAKQADTIVFDKTGTLTQGKPEVTDVLLAVSVNEQDFWQKIISAQKNSAHPLSQALLRMPQGQGLLIPESTHFQAEAGGGILAQVQGVRVVAGNYSLMQKNKVFVPDSFLQEGQRLSQQGKTVLYFSLDGQFCALMGLADTLREEAAATVEMLKKMNREIVLISGDNQKTAQAIAAKLSIKHVLAEVLPQEKEKQIALLQQQGRHVMMVGDGINDAPALARADVGVAIGAGTDVALETADIVLMKNNLLAIVAALRLSAAVLRNIKQNLFWAFFYNALGIPLAAGVFYPWLGWSLNPMFAALTMSVSSCFVVSNALRLRRFEPFEEGVVKK